jgi:hypothetical protein
LICTSLAFFSIASASMVFIPAISQSPFSKGHLSDIIYRSSPLTAKSPFPVSEFFPKILTSIPHLI